MINIYEYLVNKNTKKYKDREDPRDWEPGDIVLTSGGYNMTLNWFFRITKLVSKSTFELETLNSKLVDGYYNDPAGCHEIPDEKSTGKIIRARVSPKTGRLKIDGHTAFLWNGEPVYANHCD